MAVSMVFYSNFSKKDNSTKQPTGGTAYSVVFKDAFSILGGTVKLQVSFDTAQNYTAAKYGSKYYKVTDVVSTSNGIVEVSLSLDELATYKTNIAGYSGLIERAPSGASMRVIPDDTISNTGEILTNAQYKFKYLVIDPSKYCVQLKTVNNAAHQSYFITEASLANVANQLDGFTAGNSLSFVTEINFVNIPLSTVAAAGGAIQVSNIWIGNTEYSLGATGYAFNGPAISLKTTTISISDIPFTYDDARKINGQYTRLSFFVNNTEVQIDPAYNNADELKVAHTLDFNTLTVHTQVSVVMDRTNRPDDNDGIWNAKILYTGYTNIGVGYSLANNNAQGLKYLSTGIRLVQNTAAINPAGIIEGIANLTQREPAVSSGSAPGSTLSRYDLYFRLFLVEYGSTDKSPSEHGHPFYKTTKISLQVQQTGFYKFVNPQLPLAALDSVRDKVNSYLASGIYYE